MMPMSNSAENLLSACGCPEVCNAGVMPHFSLSGSTDIIWQLQAMLHSCYSSLSGISDIMWHPQVPSPSHQWIHVSKRRLPARLYCQGSNQSRRFLPQNPGIGQIHA